LSRRVLRIDAVQRLAGVDEALPLVEAQYREHRIRIARNRLRGALAGLSRRRGILLLARSGASAVGVAVVSWTWTVERGGKTAWLDELYVIPALRGRGIGRRLLVRAIAEARCAGCASIELEVVRGHGRAARLYRRERFAVLPRTRYSRAL
jgi:GNAT superfamily N-acetyltransferase